MKRKIIAVITILLALFSLISVPVFADDACDVMDEADSDYDLICGGSSKKNKDAQNEVGTILNTVFLYAGIVAVIVIVVGGVFYATSQGDPAKVTRAKNAILYATIGLIIVVLAFAITNFIIGAARGDY